MAAAFVKTHRLTAEEFLNRPAEDDRRHELVDGWIVAQASPRPAHSLGP